MSTMASFSFACGIIIAASALGCNDTSSSRRESVGTNVGAPQTQAKTSGTQHDKTINAIQSRHHALFAAQGQKLFKDSSDAAVFFHYWELPTLQGRDDLAKTTVIGFRLIQLTLGIVDVDLDRLMAIASSSRKENDTSAAKERVFNLISFKHGGRAGQVFAITIGRLDALATLDGLNASAPGSRNWLTGLALLQAQLRVSRGVLDAKLLPAKQLSALDAIIGELDRTPPTSLEELRRFRSTVDGWFDAAVQRVATQ